MVCVDTQWMKLDQNYIQQHALVAAVLSLVFHYHISQLSGTITQCDGQMPKGDCC